MGNVSMICPRRLNSPTAVPFLHLMMMFFSHDLFTCQKQRKTGISEPQAALHRMV